MKEDTPHITAKASSQLGCTPVDQVQSQREASSYRHIQADIVGPHNDGQASYGGLFRNRQL